MHFVLDKRFHQLIRMSGSVSQYSYVNSECGVEHECAHPHWSSLFSFLIPPILVYLKCLWVQGISRSVLKVFSCFFCDSFFREQILMPWTHFSREQILMPWTHFFREQILMPWTRIFFREQILMPRTHFFFFFFFSGTNFYD